MSSHRRSAVFLCLTLVLASCEGTSNTPVSPAVDGPGPVAAVGGSLTTLEGSPLTCDFKAAEAFAREYFDQPERQSAGEILREMRKAFEGGDVTGARELGFDVLAVAETVADAGTAAGTPEDGSDLTNAVLACMDVGHETAVDFSGALALFGAFAVRGGTDEPELQPAVLARGSSPLWGAEPVASAPWAESLGQPGDPGDRRLLYAFPLTSTGFTEETPVSSAYEWNAVPTPALIPFASDLSVGACLAQPDPKLRVQRSATILPFTALGFCPDAASSSFVDASGHQGLVERVTGALAAVLAPRPLHASAALIGGVGGRLGGFSPVVVVDAGAVNLTFTVQPVDAIVGEAFPVQVTARGNGGTPLPEVTVTLAISENNASFGELSGTTVVTTGTDGVADFLVSLNKPGGFRLTASGNLSGFETSVATSELFHIKQ